jgi:hypothetical protein
VEEDFTHQLLQEISSLLLVDAMANIDALVMFFH